MKYIRRYIFLLFIAVLVGSMASCSKKAPVIDSSVEPVKVAVNSEFLPTANLLAEQFTANTQIAVELSSGQDPELFSQLQEGSEVDVYMASDLAHPNMLVDKGIAQSEGAVVYAFGMPALYSKSWKLNWNAVDYMQSGQFTAISIPNSENPYGEAGVAALNSVGVYEDVQNKLVYTQNEADSLDKVKARQVNAGFIKFSSLSDNNKRWAWLVPQDLYPPIEQGAVLIKKNEISESAKMWMGYIQSEQAQSIIQQSGYGIVEPSDLSTSN